MRDTGSVPRTLHPLYLGQISVMGHAWHMIDFCGRSATSLRTSFNQSIHQPFLQSQRNDETVDSHTTATRCGSTLFWN